MLVKSMIREALTSIAIFSTVAVSKPLLLTGLPNLMHVTNLGLYWFSSFFKNSYYYNYLYFLNWCVVRKKR